MLISTSAIGSEAIGAASTGEVAGSVSIIPNFSQAAVGTVVQLVFTGDIVSTLSSFSQEATGSAFTILTGDITNTLPSFSQEGAGIAFTTVTSSFFFSTLPSFHMRAKGYVNSTPPDAIIYSGCLKGEILEIPKAEYTCQ